MTEKPERPSVSEMITGKLINNILNKERVFIFLTKFCMDKHGNLLNLIFEKWYQFVPVLLQITNVQQNYIRINMSYMKNEVEKMLTKGSKV